ncbi:MAG: hypothetical protein JRJ84_25635 [Deltaproteobacteria bacterium]|nr:hypothetical protein [Deltaproteobacteria bacterium]
MGADNMLSGYPPAVLRLVGDVDPAAFPRESKSSCARCPMHPPPGGDPTGRRTFTWVRCCTYQPNVPNFLVGVALSRGDSGSEQVRARLEEVDGVYVRGLVGTWEKRRRYAAQGGERFGRDATLRCPYWVEDDLSCGIYASRISVCRTWHCRYEDGEYGRDAWKALRDLLAEIELRLSWYCASAVRTPWPWSRPAVWEAYYLSCCQALERIGEQQLESMDRALLGLRVALHTTLARRDRPLPERLCTWPHLVEPVVVGTWRIAGYSRWDPVEAPVAVGSAISLIGAGESSLADS